MQEQFENEKQEPMCEPAFEETRLTPTASEAAPDPDFEERVRQEVEARVRREAEEREQRQAEERARKEEARQKLSFAANRLGWATVILIAAWSAAMFCVQSFLLVLEGFGGEEIFRFSGEAFYNKFALILNELTLAVGVAVAAVFVFSVPKVELNRERISAKHFFKLLFICFGITYVGNLIGTRILSFWNTVTGNSAGDELEILLWDMDLGIMFISSAVLAPILEELFFRKLLTERLRVFGETTAILIPAFLFALFHQSAEQVVYAFAIGVLLGYFYCRTGNYWLTVLIHAVFNTVSGFIPMLFLPKVNEFLTELTGMLGPDLSLLDTIGMTELWEMIQPLLTEYRLALGIYALYALIMLAINITGVVILIMNARKFKARSGEYALTFKESAGTVFKTPGMIVCTVLLGIMTLMSLFS